MPTRKVVLPLTGMGFGQVEQGLGCLEKAGMTSKDWQTGAIDDPLRRYSMLAAARGEISIAITSDQLLERELTRVDKFFELAMLGGLKDRGAPESSVIERAILKALVAWGSLSEHDHYIPGGLTLEDIFCAIYGWNLRQMQEGKRTLKLWHPLKEGWWRTAENIEWEPTQAGIFRQNLGMIMAPVDSYYKPFTLIYDEQVEWAKAQGGCGISTIEQSCYRIVVCLLEYGYIPFPQGWERCSNRYGSEHSLRADWCVDDGFGVGSGDRSDRYWCCGATSWKFIGA